MAAARDGMPPDRPWHCVRGRAVERRPGKRRAKHRRRPQQVRPGRRARKRRRKREAKEKRREPTPPAKRERRSRANGRVLKKGTAQPEGITNGGSDRSGCVSQALCLKRVEIRDKKVDRASVCRSDKEKRAETGPISVRFSGNQNRAIRIRCSKILLLSLARRWQTQRWCAP